MPTRRSFLGGVAMALVARVLFRDEKRPPPDDDYSGHRKPPRPPATTTTAPSPSTTTTPPSNPMQLPPPDTAGRIFISTADDPQTVIDAQPSGRFFFQSGTHSGRTFVFNGSDYDGVDLLGDPGVTFDGS